MAATSMCSDFGSKWYNPPAIFKSFLAKVLVFQLAIVLIQHQNKIYLEESKAINDNCLA